MSNQQLNRCGWLVFAVGGFTVDFVYWSGGLDLFTKRNRGICVIDEIEQTPVILLT